MNAAHAPQGLISFLTPFFVLSHPTSPPAAPNAFKNSSYYEVGLLDGCFIIGCIAVMAVLRDALRLGVFEPFARWYLTRQLLQSKAKQNGHANGHTNGHTNGHAATEAKSNGATNGHARHDGPVITKREARKVRRSVMRFAEQGWSVVYYTLQWLYGLYVHRNLPTQVLNPVDVWIGYPHLPLAGPLKFYYLTQSAFYLHQVLILNAEARRKDHWQMMTHHVITIVLMLGSYSYNYTRVGCLVMMLMDLCDIFLPLAKMLRYLGFTTVCDVMFVVFMLSWLVTRHFLFLFVIKSTYYDAPRLTPFIWDPATGHFTTKEVLNGFNAMLCALQVIQLVWFGMICRVAYGVVTGRGAEDTRSDSEDDGTDENGEAKKER
ncbi:longevity assurance proteins LAG1/LAC1 [Phanerochaete sordida]|uniref:Longevity assurance proteins LAG1/LAC1 n=1 Tax=Phanerochaete sordida TaxID=48140 RepID=A0A9P3FZG8_9APHY|nr:longevity assurance proteins LAG1/LAC1 [Phanerochaete sordida]